MVKEILKKNKEKISEEILDMEPTWRSLIPIYLNMKDKELAQEELMKIVKIADMMRQTQKNKEKLVFDFRDGNKK